MGERLWLDEQLEKARTERDDLRRLLDLSEADFKRVVAELLALRAENERLREALDAIKSKAYPDRMTKQEMNASMIEIVSICLAALSAEKQNANDDDQHDADDADAAARSISIEGMVTAKPSE